MVLCLLFCVIMHIEQEALFRQVHLGEEPVSENYRRQLKTQQKCTVRIDPDVLNTIDLHGKNQPCGNKEMFDIQRIFSVKF